MSFDGGKREKRTGPTGNLTTIESIVDAASGEVHVLTVPPFDPADGTGSRQGGIGRVMEVTTRNASI